MAQTAQRVTSSESSLPENGTVLELAETQEVLESINFEFLGLARVREGNTTKVIRMDKPLITAEFARLLINTSYTSLNRLSGRTTFTNEQILLSMKSFMRCSVELFFNHFHHAVTDDLWREVEKLNELVNPENKPVIQIDDGTSQKVNIRNNYWWKKYNVVWSRNMPVTFRMIEIIQTQEGFTMSDTNRRCIHPVYHDLLLKYVTLHQSSLNRSLDGLTLNHEKVTHKETFAHSSESVGASNENMYQQLKAAVTNR